MTKRLPALVAPAVAVAIVLAACGSNDEPAAGPIDPPSETTAPPTDEASDGLRAPTPVEVVAGGFEGAAAEPAAVESSDAATGELSMIAPWSFEYVVADGLPALPTDAVGYTYDAEGPATADQVAALAATFGVEGEPRRNGDDVGGGWQVGPDDGSASSLWVGDDGQLSWNYSAPWAVDRAIDVCAVSVDADGTETTDCPEPEPPTGVPSADEARQRATDLVAALGLDPAVLTFDTFADEWFASVDVSEQTDAGAAVRRWSFGFGADGVLQYGSGSLAAPVAVGPYPLIGLDDAIARLSEPFYGGGFGIATPAIEAVSEPAPESGTAVEEPTETLPIETVVVELVDVVADLWWAWDADGTVHLLPAYRFIDRDGGWHVVPAVTDDFLKVVDPGLLGEPIPVEPDGGAGGGAEPLPPPETIPVETLPVDSVPVEPGTDPEGALPTLEQWVGLSIEEFTANAESIGFTTRIVQLDGEFLAGTADYRTDRVNVVVEGPRVTAIDSIG